MGNRGAYLNDEKVRKEGRIQERPRSEEIIGRIREALRSSERHPERIRVLFFCCQLNRKADGFVDLGVCRDPGQVPQRGKGLLSFSSKVAGYRV